ncbi:MAG: hypothetical protein ACHQC8_07095 [Solirubrobacterales bacterium]
MTYEIRNVHLVAIDASTKGRLVVAMPPRSSLTKEQALMFAAWLVTTADAAEGSGLDHLAFAHAVSEWRRLYSIDPTTGNLLAHLDAMQGVTVTPTAFLPLAAARELAAAVVAVALEGRDLAPFFDRVAAVHNVVRDGSELERVLTEEGEPVKLKPPVKRIDVPFEAGERAIEKALGLDELDDHEAQTDAGRRRTVPKS